VYPRQSHGSACFLVNYLVQEQKHPRDSPRGSAQCATRGDRLVYMSARILCMLQGDEMYPHGVV
jgi:hypothetical protein